MPWTSNFLFQFTVRIISFAALLGTMLFGVFAAAGVCAALFGSQILDTALGDPPDRSHPAFYLFLLLAVLGLLIGACGGVFGIVIPLYWRFNIPLGKRDALFRHWLHWYALQLSKYTKAKT